LWHTRGTNVGEAIHTRGSARRRTHGQVAVDARDHGQARAGVARDLEHPDAGRQPVGDGCVAEVVDAAPVDAGGLERRLPFASPPVVEIQVRAAPRREHELRVGSPWRAVEGSERAARERHRPPARVRLPERLRALRPECALDDYDALGSLQVPPFEREPLGGSQCGLGGEHHERAVRRAELGRDPVHLRERERLDLGAARLPVGPRLTHRIGAHEAPAHASLEHLPERRHDPIR
jgi:hypothetical protein